MYRKALPKYASIVELVEPHTCLPQAIDFDLSPSEVPVYTPKAPVDNLPKFGMASTSNLRDRRFESDSDIKSVAPESIRSMIDSMANSQPSKPLTDLPEGED
jgi:hypothetical protein